MVADRQFLALEKEIVGLFNNIQRIKQELASVTHPEGGEDMIGTVADQVNAIAEETSRASHDILEASAGIAAINEELLEQIKFAGARHFFETISAHVRRIDEACSFHEVTAERLSKIVHTVNVIEGTLNSLVVIVGEDGIAALPRDAADLDPEHDS